MILPIEKLESMPPAEEKEFWSPFKSILANDDGQAA